MYVEISHFQINYPPKMEMSLINYIFLMRNFIKVNRVIKGSMFHLSMAKITGKKKDLTKDDRIIENVVSHKDRQNIYSLISRSIIKLVAGQ